MGGRDRVPRRRSRRVDDPDEREQREPVEEWQQVGARDRTSRGRSPCAPSRAHAGPALPGARSRPRSARASRRRPAIGCRSSALSVDEPRASTWSGAPLTKQRTTSRPDSSSIRWNVAMSLYVASNGSSATRGYCLPRRRRVEPTLLAQHDQCAFGGVADHLAVVHHGVAREDHRQHELLEIDIALPGDPLDPALRGVAVAVDRVAAARDRQLDRRHLVERQRPGLVGVDRRGRAERLRRAKTLHDRVRLGERLRPHREDRRDDGGEARGDRGDRERDRRRERPS